MILKILFCFFTMIARTLAVNEVACCPPKHYMSTKIVKDKIVCFTSEKNDTTPGLFECEFRFLNYLYESFNFKEDGKVDLHFGSDESEHVEVTDRYCTGEMISIDQNITAKVGIVCLDPPEVQINGYITFVSVAFLILTVFIYSVMSELRDLLGKSFINLCSSLAIGLCIFAIILLMSDNYSDTNLCAARGFLAYYFLLVSFFWTTAISTQLLQNIRSPSSVDRGWKTFIWYASFAWGCPLLITICMAIVNFHPGNHAKPGIGIDSCWFENIQNVQIWYWLYSVLTILISINIMIFVYISYFMCRNKFASSQAAQIKYKFFMSLKLFVVMGIYWIFELIQSVDQRDLVIWTILSIVTSLQGVWIFLVLVVFRKRVIKAMHKRGWLACISGPVEKYLANADGADDDILEHTSVPMNER